MVVAGAEKGTGKLFNGYRVLVILDEKSFVVMVVQYCECT